MRGAKRPPAAFSEQTAMPPQGGGAIRRRKMVPFLAPSPPLGGEGRVRRAEFGPRIFRIDGHKAGGYNIKWMKSTKNISEYPEIF